MDRGIVIKMTPHYNTGMNDLKGFSDLDQLIILYRKPMQTDDKLSIWSGICDTRKRRESIYDYCLNLFNLCKI